MSVAHHLAINCVDRLAQERFYRDLFGFRRVRVFNAGQPNEFVMLRLDGFCIELFDAPHGGQADDVAVGFKHFAFEVDDLEATRARLVELGVEPEKLIDCGHLVPGLKICFFHDPEGNRIELMEHWVDDETL